jgi:hypothetical protein
VVFVERVLCLPGAQAWRAARDALVIRCMQQLLVSNKAWAIRSLAMHVLPSTADDARHTACANEELAFKTCQAVQQPYSTAQHSTAHNTAGSPVRS